MRKGIYLIAAVFLLVSCGSTGATINENTVFTNINATSNPTTKIAIASPTALAEPTPTQTLTPLPSPTPSPVLIQLTRGGCCVQPFWSPDSEQVLYIDRPAFDQPSGIWGITMPGSETNFITDRVGLYSDDMRLRAYLENGQTMVENIQSGEQWTVPSEGRAVSFSPDGEWATWTAGQAGPPFDSAQRDVWVSRFNGNEARKLFSVTGGGFAGWFPNGELLVAERTALEGSGQIFWIISPFDSQPRKLLEISADGRIRGIDISPNGRWLVYMHSISNDESQNGLWIVNTETGNRRRLDTFGAYQWRDGERLLVIPLDLNGAAQWLQQIEATSGKITAITEPNVTPFRVANGDWHISPNGERIAFVSAEDQNIWVLELPSWK